MPSAGTPIDKRKLSQRAKDIMALARPSTSHTLSLPVLPALAGGGAGGVVRPASLRPATDQGTRPTAQVGSPYPTLVAAQRSFSGGAPVPGAGESTARPSTRSGAVLPEQVSRPRTSTTGPGTEVGQVRRPAPRKGIPILPVQAELRPTTASFVFQQYNLRKFLASDRPGTSHITGFTRPANLKALSPPSSRAESASPQPEGLDDPFPLPQGHHSDDESDDDMVVALDQGHFGFRARSRLGDTTDSLDSEFTLRETPSSLQLPLPTVSLDSPADFLRVESGQRSQPPQNSQPHRAPLHQTSAVRTIRGRDGPQQRRTYPTSLPDHLEQVLERKDGAHAILSVIPVNRLAPALSGKDASTGLSKADLDGWRDVTATEQTGHVEVRKQRAEDSATLASVDVAYLRNDVFKFQDITASSEDTPAERERRRRARKLVPKVADENVKGAGSGGPRGARSQTHPVLRASLISALAGSTGPSDRSNQIDDGRTTDLLDGLLPPGTTAVRIGDNERSRLGFGTTFEPRPGDPDYVPPPPGVTRLRIAPLPKPPQDDVQEASPHRVDTSTPIDAAISVPADSNHEDTDKPQGASNVVGNQSGTENSVTLSFTELTEGAGPDVRLKVQAMEDPDSLTEHGAYPWSLRNGIASQTKRLSQSNPALLTEQTSTETGPLRPSLQLERLKVEQPQTDLSRAAGTNENDTLTDGEDDESTPHPYDQKKLAEIVSTINQENVSEIIQNLETLLPEVAPPFDFENMSRDYQPRRKRNQYASYTYEAYSAELQAAERIGGSQIARVMNWRSHADQAGDGPDLMASSDTVGAANNDSSSKQSGQRSSKSSAATGRSRQLARRLGGVARGEIKWAAGSLNANSRPNSTGGPRMQATPTSPDAHANSDSKESNDNRLTTKVGLQQQEHRSVSPSRHGRALPPGVSPGLLQMLEDLLSPNAHISSRVIPPLLAKTSRSASAMGAMGDTRGNDRYHKLVRITEKLAEISQEEEAAMAVDKEMGMIASEAQSDMTDEQVLDPESKNAPQVGGLAASLAATFGPSTYVGATSLPSSPTTDQRPIMEVRLRKAQVLCEAIDIAIEGLPTLADRLSKAQISGLKQQLKREKLAILDQYTKGLYPDWLWRRPDFRESTSRAGTDLGLAILETLPCERSDAHLNRLSAWFGNESQGVSIATLMKSTSSPPTLSTSSKGDGIKRAPTGKLNTLRQGTKRASSSSADPSSAVIMKPQWTSDDVTQSPFDAPDDLVGMSAFGEDASLSVTPLSSAAIGQMAISISISVLDELERWNTWQTRRAELTALATSILEQVRAMRIWRRNVRTYLKLMRGTSTAGGAALPDLSVLAQQFTTQHSALGSPTPRGLHPLPLAQTPSHPAPSNVASVAISFARAMFDMQDGDGASGSSGQIRPGQEQTFFAYLSSIVQAIANGVPLTQEPDPNSFKRVLRLTARLPPPASASTSHSLETSQQSPDTIVVRQPDNTLQPHPVLLTIVGKLVSALSSMSAESTGAGGPSQSKSSGMPLAESTQQSNGSSTVRNGLNDEGPTELSSVKQTPHTTRGTVDGSASKFDFESVTSSPSPPSDPSANSGSLRPGLTIDVEWGRRGSVETEAMYSAPSSRGALPSLPSVLPGLQTLAASTTTSQHSTVPALQLTANMFPLHPSQLSCTLRSIYTTNATAIAASKRLASLLPDGGSTAVQKIPQSPRSILPAPQLLPVAGPLSSGSIEWLLRQPKHLLPDILRLVRVRRVPAGGIIYRRGDPALDFFMVHSGIVLRRFGPIDDSGLQHSVTAPTAKSTSGSGPLSPRTLQPSWTSPALLAAQTLRRQSVVQLGSTESQGPSSQAPSNPRPPKSIFTFTPSGMPNAAGMASHQVPGGTGLELQPWNAISHLGATPMHQREHIVDEWALSVIRAAGTVLVQAPLSEGYNSVEFSLQAHSTQLSAAGENGSSSSASSENSPDLVTIASVCPRHVPTKSGSLLVTPLSVYQVSASSDGQPPNQNAMRRRNSTVLNMSSAPTPLAKIFDANGKKIKQPEGLTASKDDQPPNPRYVMRGPVYVPVLPGKMFGHEVISIVRSELQAKKRKKSTLRESQLRTLAPDEAQEAKLRKELDRKVRRERAEERRRKREQAECEGKADDESDENLNNLEETNDASTRDSSYSRRVKSRPRKDGIRPRSKHGTDASGNREYTDLSEDSDELDELINARELTDEQLLSLDQNALAKRRHRAAIRALRAVEQEFGPIDLDQAQRLVSSASAESPDSPRLANGEDVDVGRAIANLVGESAVKDTGTNSVASAEDRLKRIAELQTAIAIVSQYCRPNNQPSSESKRHRSKGKHKSTSTADQGHSYARHARDRRRRKFAHMVKDELSMSESEEDEDDEDLVQPTFSMIRDALRDSDSDSEDDDETDDEDVPRDDESNEHISTPERRSDKGLTLDVSSTASGGPEYILVREEMSTRSSGIKGGDLTHLQQPATLGSDLEENMLTEVRDVDGLVMKVRTDSAIAVTDCVLLTLSFFGLDTVELRRKQLRGQQAVAFLKTTPTFYSSGPSRLRLLQRLLVTRHFQPGQIIWRQGDVVGTDTIAVVMTGYVTLYREIEVTTGRSWPVTKDSWRVEETTRRVRIPVRVARAKEIFGEEATFKYFFRDYTVVAGRDPTFDPMALVTETNLHLDHFETYDPDDPFPHDPAHSDPDGGATIIFLRNRSLRGNERAQIQPQTQRHRVSAALRVQKFLAKTYPSSHVKYPFPVCLWAREADTAPLWLLHYRANCNLILHSESRLIELQNKNAQNDIMNYVNEDGEILDENATKLELYQRELSGNSVNTSRDSQDPSSRQPKMHGLESGCVYVRHFPPLTSAIQGIQPMDLNVPTSGRDAESDNGRGIELASVRVAPDQVTALFKVNSPSLLVANKAPTSSSTAYSSGMAQELVRYPKRMLKPKSE